MPANNADGANSSAVKTDLQGLELAEHHFGPLLHPTHATQSAWTNYSINRLQTNPNKGPENGSEEDSEEYEYDECSDETWLFDSVETRISQIEDGILQKTSPFYVTKRYSTTTRSRDLLTHQFSPACVGQRSSGLALSPGTRFNTAHLRRRAMHLPSTKGSVRAVLRMCTRAMGVRPCAGVTMMTPMETGEDWRRIECGKVELWTFRSLVRNILLLPAAVGIPYNVACTDNESDNGPHDLMLQGLSDKWVGRGIRNACGLRLARDAEERECAQEQREEAKGYDGDSEDDKNGDDDFKYGL
ncbi:hypothetical protein EDB19DRAFT_1827025 [Suillus lakei]|nr:hypothetical protein EDB19DRAFT_1827025 [Suillus lakei]